MTAYLLLVVATLFQAASAGITQLVILTFRNPMREGMLRSEWLAIGAVLALLVLYGLTTTAQIYMLLEVGAGSIASSIIAVAVFGGTLWLNDRLFGLRERLRRADAGESPFYRSGGSVASSATPSGA